jgi:NAD(P)-dependent dehydrogenase (short-subunit alcohol dehydrogenase family)
MGSRDINAGQNAAQHLRSEGLDVTAIQVDVSDDQSCDQLLAQISKEHGIVNVLVNNAGILADPARHPPDREAASILNVSLDVIRNSMEVNTYGAIRLIQRLLPLMMANGYGRIVNVSSGMGQLADMNGGWPGYRISKVGLNAVTRIVADETTGTNVLVNSVCPGWVRTDMGGPEAELSPSDAADSIAWLATLPDGGPSGKFFRDREEIPW